MTLLEKYDARKEVRELADEVLANGPVTWSAIAAEVRERHCYEKGYWSEVSSRVVESIEKQCAWLEETGSSHATAPESVWVVILGALVNRPVFR